MDVNNIEHRSSAIGDAAVVTHRRVDLYASHPRGGPPAKVVAGQQNVSSQHRLAVKLRLRVVYQISSQRWRGGAFSINPFSSNSKMLVLEDDQGPLNDPKHDALSSKLRGFASMYREGLQVITTCPSFVDWLTGRVLQAVESPNFRDDPHDAHARTSVCMCVGSQRGVHR
jgi:hypothetical protein